MPPGSGQDSLVEVCPVPMHTAGALGEAGQRVLHYYYHEYYCYYYYDCYYHLEDRASSGVNVGLGCVTFIDIDNINTRHFLKLFLSIFEILPAQPPVH